MNSFIIILIISLVKLAAAPFFPLIGDEAFYWVWGQHLDFNYTAHPPMIAYFNFILTTVFGHNYLVIRFGAIAIVLIISWLIYLTGRELYDRRTGQMAAVIFNLLPTFFGGGMFLVPQTILFLFWTWSFYLIVKITRTGQGRYWYWLGLSAGLGLISDHIMGLFFIGTIFYCAADKNLRCWFSRKEPYLAVLLSFLIFLPSLLWTLNQELNTFLYWGGKMGGTPRIADNLLNFFGLQMLLYTPPIFCLTVWLIFRGFWKPKTGCSSPVSLFSIFSTVVWLPFLLISPLAMVGGHWPATAYLPAILESGRTKKWLFRTIIGFALLVNTLGFSYYLFLYPTPPELKGKEFSVNQQLAQFIKDSTPLEGKTFYLADDIGTFGLVSFHGRVQVYPPPGRLEEAAAWGRANIQKGDNVIYFTRENTSEIQAGLTAVFRKVVVEPQKRLFTKDADIPTKMTIFHCYDYKGGVIP